MSRFLEARIGSRGGAAFSFYSAMYPYSVEPSARWSRAMPYILSRTVEPSVGKACRHSGKSVLFLVLSTLYLQHHVSKLR